MWGEPASPRQRRGMLEGDAFIGNLHNDEGDAGHVHRHTAHAPPLGRAHIASVNPEAIGCDRPEPPTGGERAGFVTLRRRGKAATMALGIHKNS